MPAPPRPVDHRLDIRPVIHLPRHQDVEIVPKLVNFLIGLDCPCHRLTSQLKVCLMKKLPPIRPTPEQLPLISTNSLGIEVIRGAAGSGKTSTAILRLHSLALMFEQRHAREGIVRPLKILVLTFNRTLSGYISALVDEQVGALRNTSLEVETFGRWAMSHIGYPKVVTDSAREKKVKALARRINGLSPEYVVKELDYLLGRFPADRLDQYLLTERTGRGAEPRVDRATRKRLLEEVVEPYKRWLNEAALVDWNDVALQMQELPHSLNYDIAIVDESQDFSANQLRSLRRHISDDYAVTFVIDTVQRIYARGFAWAETGFSFRGARYHSLRENHRNTVEIASFASGVLTGMPIDADGTLPDLSAASRRGPKPVVIRGTYPQQADYAFEYILENIDLAAESVAFLKPQGGQFFREVKRHLRLAGLPFVEISREAEWPEGDENIALCTFHSAKGLEFDHVVILGLSDINTVHGEAAVDDQLVVLRRLFAVAVARARKSVIIGYKPGEESRLVEYFQSGTFEEVTL